MDQTPVAKLLPPARPAGCIPREALVGRIATVLNRRLTTVVAEAGYGKSTLLAQWWEMVPCAWYTADATDLDVSSLARQLSDAIRLRVPKLPAALARGAEGASGPEAGEPSRADALGSRIAQVLHEHLEADLLLVIDDVDELGAGGPSARLIEAICRHAPARLHLVLAGRRHPPFPVERLRGRGQLLEIGGDQLAFTAAEVAELVRDRLGPQGAKFADELYRLAGGWPAAVLLALEALRESPPETWPGVVAGLDRPHAPLIAYLAEEVFAHQPVEVRELVSRVAIFEHFTPELGEVLGIGGARAIIGDLARQSLFVETRQDGSLALRPLIREYALEHLALSEPSARELRIVGAEWFAGTGNIAAATRLLVTAGASEQLVSLVAKQGPTLLAAGQVATVIDACTAIPAPLRSAQIEQLEGEARQIQGDWTGALTCFERAAPGVGDLPASLAWRMGLLHYLRGHLDDALEVYRRGLDDDAAEPQEMALLLAWTATAHWLRGDVAPCRSLASQALAMASTSGDGRALAAAHTVLAMLGALDGDRRGNDAHYLLALRAAEEAGDVLQTVRIRSNRASHFLEEGSYPEALQELEVAVKLAELTSFASFLALSLCNRGETKLRMGRLDEALADLEQSRDRYQRIGSSMVAYPLTTIGEVHRERGNLAQARAAFEEAVSVAETSGDQQGLVPALAGLATVLAGEDPERARELAERAVAGPTGPDHVSALIAAGWVAVGSGDALNARQRAADATAEARSRRDRAGLADALTLAALSAENPRREAPRLREAAAIWREVGNPLGEAKVELALATIEPGPGAATRRSLAERRLEALGVHGHRGRGAAAGLLALVGSPVEQAVRIESLGGFALLREGELVRTSEWQSKRSRELLKLLVSRRGRPTTRGYLMETLWPDEEPERVTNRLSVALTTIRGVLDPKRQAKVEYVLSDKDAVALNLDAVDVDLERFLDAATDGLAKLRRGDLQAGLPLLEAAAAAYAGDFLEENPYDEWAAAPREEARAAHIAVTRALALQAVSASDPDGAALQFMRLLQVDRYDEQANLGLVRALVETGRHGEAHRHYLEYRRAMDDLGVEPAPFPGGRAPLTGDAQSAPPAPTQH